MGSKISVSIIAGYTGLIIAGLGISAFAIKSISDNEFKQLKKKQKQILRDKIAIFESLGIRDVEEYIYKCLQILLTARKENKLLGKDFFDNFYSLVYSIAYYQIMEKRALMREDRLLATQSYNISSQSKLHNECIEFQDSQFMFARETVRSALDIEMDYLIASEISFIRVKADEFAELTLLGPTHRINMIENKNPAPQIHIDKMRQVVKFIEKRVEARHSHGFNNCDINKVESLFLEELFDEVYARFGTDLDCFVAQAVLSGDQWELREEFQSMVDKYKKFLVEVFRKKELFQSQNTLLM